MAVQPRCIVRNLLWTLSFLMVDTLAACRPISSEHLDIPPRAAPITGSIEQVQLGPVFAERYACVEHALELVYAGDMLGTDCQVGSTVEVGMTGFFTLYRSDGKTNADWYSWHANVLAPFDGRVVYVLQSKDENVPGVLGSSPAGTLRFENDDGVIVTYGHVTEIAVKINDKVKAGQIVAKVGNNGASRAPHIHIGAHRKADAMPLQIRWDLRAMAQARTRVGIK